SLKAAEELTTEGISCEVWDPRTLAPFDRDGFRASLARTGRLVIAHEAPVRGGYGAEIAAYAAEHCLDLLKAPVVRVGGRNTPVPYAPEMEGYVLPGPERIKEGVRRCMAASGRRSGGEEKSDG